MPHEASPTIRNVVFRAAMLVGVSLVTTSVAAAAVSAEANGNLSPSCAATAALMRRCRSAQEGIARYTAATASAKCGIPEAGVLASVSLGT